MVRLFFSFASDKKLRNVLFTTCTGASQNARGISACYNTLDHTLSLPLDSQGTINNIKTKHGNSKTSCRIHGVWTMHRSHGGWTDLIHGALFHQMYAGRQMDHSHTSCLVMDPSHISRLEMDIHSSSSSRCHQCILLLVMGTLTSAC